MTPDPNGFSNKRTICVYCAASSAAPQSYKDAADETGRAIARAGLHLVYGGAHIGLMGVVADAALAEGGRVTGVIPDFLQKRELAHGGISELYVTHTLQERQTKMADLSDMFLALPGGLGTLAELMEIMTWRQLGLHTKPIGLLNIEGYWDPLLAMLAQAREKSLLHGAYEGVLSELTLEELPGFLKGE